MCLNSPYGPHGGSLKLVLQLQFKGKITMLRLFEVINLQTLVHFLWLSLFTDKAYKSYSGQKLLHLMKPSC